MSMTAGDPGEGPAQHLYQADDGDLLEVFGRSSTAVARSQMNRHGPITDDWRLSQYARQATAPMLVAMTCRLARRTWPSSGAGA